MDQQPLLARAFVRAADTLADDFDVSAHLRELCGHYVDLLDIDAAEVVLGDDADSLRLVATSRALVLGADAAAPYDQESPARRSFTTGEQVCVRDLRTAAPVFPRFVRTAMQAGYAAAHTFPLRLRTQIVGAVTVCRVRPGSLPPDQVAIALSLADAATIGLLQQRARQQKCVMVEQLQGALDSRVVIEQAKGILAERLGVHVDRAFEQMRAFARPRRLKLTDVAAGIVRGGGEVGALTAMAANRPAEVATAAVNAPGKGNGADAVAGLGNGKGHANGHLNGHANGHRSGSANVRPRSGVWRPLAIQTPGQRVGRSGSPEESPEGRP